VRWTICATYDHEDRSDAKQVDIYADITTAKPSLQAPADDLQRFADYFFPAGLDNEVIRVLTAPRVPLTPTISLVGENPANVVVQEIPEFNVLVSHVEDGAKNQAVVAAFNVMPGNMGSLNEVPHFVSHHQYGVIHDEYVIERVLKHKWNRGGFDRQLMLQGPIEVQRPQVRLGGVQFITETATMYATMDLLTLDAVAIETDSNRRTDVIKLSGQSRITANHMILGDGTYVGSDDADFPAPENKPWGVVTSPSLAPDYSPVAEIAQFQQRAEQDGYQHIAKPFARLPTDAGSVIIPAYYRLEGVTKLLCVLGDLREPFV